MSTSTIQNMLQHEIATLPDDLAASVYDFVLYMKARYTEDTFLWNQVEQALAYRQSHPEEVQSLSAEEWLHATAYLDKDNGI